MVSTLHIEPKQLAEYWEAFSLNQQVDELTEHTFQGYRTEVMKQSGQEGAVVSRSALGKRQASTMVTPPNKRVQGTSLNTTPVSAVDKVASSRNRMSPNKVTPHGPSPPTVNIISYGERKNAGQVLVTYNPNDLEPVTQEDSSKPRCIVSSDDFSTNVQTPYRHMFTTLEERAVALDDHLNEMGNAMVQRYEIGKDDGIAALEAVGVPRQDKVCCIGRICNEV